MRKLSPRSEIEARLDLDVFRAVEKISDHIGLDLNLYAQNDFIEKNYPTGKTYGREAAKILANGDKLIVYVQEGGKAVTIETFDSDEKNRKKIGIVKIGEGIHINVYNGADYGLLKLDDLDTNEVVQDIKSSINRSENMPQYFLTRVRHKIGRKIIKDKYEEKSELLARFLWDIGFRSQDLSKLQSWDIEEDGLTAYYEFRLNQWVGLHISDQFAVLSLQRQDIDDRLELALDFANEHRSVMSRLVSYPEIAAASPNHGFEDIIRKYSDIFVHLTGIIKIKDKK